MIIIISQLKESTLINTTEHDKIKDTVTNVLVNCQIYMRNQNVRTTNNIITCLVVYIIIIYRMNASMLVYETL